jgi:Kef-type K+ transport system membrane component KefB
MAHAPTANEIAALLAAVGAIALGALAVGALTRRLGQPAVIGEMLLGVLAGPTVLNGAIGRVVLVPAVRPLLTAVANLGLALFMFLVGLELEPIASRGGAKGERSDPSLATVLTVAFGAVAVPTALGAGLGLHLAGRATGTQRLAFVIFIAAAMSVTAFPVLARILRDRDLEDTKVGQLALRSAAVSDVVAWLLLALALLVSHARGGPGWRAAAIVPFGAAMGLLVRPALRRLAAGGGDSDRLRAALIAGALCSAALTSWMGLHPAFGAFLFGAIVPTGAGTKLRAELARGLGEVVLLVLLPIYFVMAGVSVNAGTIQLGALALVLLVAVAGKLLGTYAAARLRRLSRPEASRAAVLMNARGITELVVLGVGLQAGVISARTYALMVVMTLITTAATGPLLLALDKVEARQPGYEVPQPPSLAEAETVR